MKETSLKEFDLENFLLGITPETRFVTVYADNRAAAQMKKLREEWYKAKDREKDMRPGVGEALPSEKIKAEYDKLQDRLEESAIEVEIREVVQSVRAAITEEFKSSKNVTAEQIQEDLPGLGAQLDYWTMAKAIVYPPLQTPEAVERFALAIGDAQWAEILEAWLSTLNVNLAGEVVDPNFLLEYSTSDGGEE